MKSPLFLKIILFFVPLVSVLSCFGADRWEKIGQNRFTKYPVESNLYRNEVCFDSSGNPYIIYDTTGNKRSVERFTGKEWENLGLFDGLMNDKCRITMDSKDRPFLFYIHEKIEYCEVNVEKWEKDKWISVFRNRINGYDPSPYGDFCIGKNDALYLFYAYNHYKESKIFLLRHADNGWKSIGGVSDMTHFITSGNGDVYGTNSARYARYNVYKLDGRKAVKVKEIKAEDNFVDVNPRFSATDHEGNLYYDDINHIFVKCDENGNTHIGDAINVESDGISYYSMDFSPGNVPYIAYTEPKNDWHVHVKKLSGDTWVDVGGGFATNVRTSLFNIYVPKEGVIYIAYFQAGDSSSRPSMVRYQEIK